MTHTKQSSIEVLGPERRWRWCIDENWHGPGKLRTRAVRVTGCSRYGINPNQLFHWRKLHQHGSLSAVRAGEAVLPASKLADMMKQIRMLQRLLGKKIMESEILKDAVGASAGGNGLRTRPCYRRAASETGQ